MHGDIFIYYKVLFYLLSLINDISEFRSDQITFLSRPTYCRAASISHLQTFSVHGRMTNKFFSQKSTTFHVQVHAMSVQQTLGQLSLLFNCCVNVSFLLAMSLLIFLDALEDVIVNVTIKLRFYGSDRFCYENNERVMIM